MKQSPDARDGSAYALYAASKAIPMSAPLRGFSRLNETTSPTEGFRRLSDPPSYPQRVFTSLPSNGLTNKDVGREGIRHGRDAEERFIESAECVLFGLGYDYEIVQSGELDAQKVDTRVRWRRAPQEPWTTTDIQVSVGDKSRSQQKRLRRAGITPVVMPIDEPAEITDMRVLFLFLSKDD